MLSLCLVFFLGALMLGIAAYGDAGDAGGAYGETYGDANECLDGLAYSIIGALTDKVTCLNNEAPNLELVCGGLEQGMECSTPSEPMNSTNVSTHGACQVWCQSLNLDGNICCQWDPSTDSCDIFESRFLNAAIGTFAASCKPNKFEATPLGQVCSDIGKPEITTIKDCKEVAKWIDKYQFTDQTSSPDPNVPKGCYVVVGRGTRLGVVWNPVLQGQPNPNISTICLKSEESKRPTVTVLYSGTEPVDENSSSRLGTYELIGAMAADNSSIYAHVTKNAGKSVILIDWQGDNNWIGTGFLDIHLEAAKWLETNCTEKLIKECSTDSWAIRKEMIQEDWIRSNLHVIYDVSL